MRIIRRGRCLVAIMLVLGAPPECGRAHARTSAQAEPSGVDEAAIPPLCDAALRGDLRKVRVLLRKRNPIDVRFEGETPLMKSLAPYIGMPRSTMAPPSAKERRVWEQRVADKIEIARLLLKAGADVRLTSKDGSTPLHFAALAHAPDDLLVPIVRDLIKRGALIDAQTSEGATPLQFAVWKKRAKIAKALVIAGANLDLRDGRGKSAADELVADGRQDELDELRRLSAERGTQASPESSLSPSRN